MAKVLGQGAAAAMVLALSILPARAGDLPASSPQAQEMMKVYFTNARTCHGPTWDCQTYFQPDGTYVRFSFRSVGTPEDPQGLHGQEGKWWAREEDGVLKLCRQAASETKANCGVEKGKKVGDTWSMLHTSGPDKGMTEVWTVTEGRH